ncbi:hypothetical protein K435DRAFT_811761 [Dendrothele bispora CBS 962.96]|uniref:Uncharacterized protein n=1 Tax=Dendrothele bispora (strain CBS 962.96) TaxID=1314807 RepID=A0A4S8KR26_DENBC|nr:hypothetical protein K435DRAFT_811761 [Dendrothele bispora CBS 962.96]
MAVPPPFMSQPLRRNNGQRQAASPPPPQPTNSSETRASDFQHVTRSSPVPSDSRATARPSSDQEDTTAGSKHAYVGSSERAMELAEKKASTSTLLFFNFTDDVSIYMYAMSPYIPISTTFCVAHAADDPDDPFIEDMPDEEISRHVDVYNLLLISILVTGESIFLPILWLPYD